MIVLKKENPGNDSGSLTVQKILKPTLISQGYLITFSLRTVMVVLVSQLHDESKTL